MSHTSTISRSRLSSALHLLATPFISFGRFLVLLAESNPKLRQLERLSRVSDEQLASKGKTREGEIRRIMGASAYL